MVFQKGHNASASQTGEKKKKTGKKVKLNFGTYIHRLQKKADSKTRLSMKALGTIDHMVTNLVTEMAVIIGELNRKTKKQTMSLEDVKAAIKLKCQDGELAKHCVMEGSKAVMKFQKK